MAGESQIAGVFGQNPPPDQADNSGAGPAGQGQAGASPQPGPGTGPGQPGGVTGTGLPEKFGGNERAFYKSYSELAARLGRENDLDRHATLEDAVATYLEMERQLTTQGGTQDGSDLDGMDVAELILLQQQQREFLQSLAQVAAQGSGLPGQPAIPPGQFPPGDGRLPAQPQAGGELKLPEPDLSSFGDAYQQNRDLEADPAGFTAKVVKTVIDQIYGPFLATALETMFRPVVGFIQTSRTREQYMAEIEAFRETHPDVNEYAAEIAQIFDQAPYLVQFRGDPQKGIPSGLEQAYNMAKVNRAIAKRINKRQKGGLGIPPSRQTGGQRQSGPATYADAVRQGMRSRHTGSKRQVFDD